MGRSRFQNHWMERREFVDWLRRDSNDVFRAYCQVCQLSFDVKNMGEGAVKSHGAEAKHVANMTQWKQLTRTTNSIAGGLCQFIIMICSANLYLSWPKLFRTFSLHFFLDKCINNF